jgi:Ca-activated chloride channel family protein
MRSLRPALHTLAALAIVSTAHFPASIRAQEQQRPVFRSRVAVVPITAVVRDSKSRIVRDLQQDDFRVFENSEPRPIIDFRSTNHGPVSLAVLFDTSGSMRGRNLELATEVLDQLLQGLDRSKDEVALFTFDEGIRQLTPFTSDIERIREALDRAEAWGLTSIYDAVAEAATRVGARQSQRRAVVVITDGLDTSSSLTPAEVSSVASAIDVPAYVIAVEAPRGPRGEAGLQAADDLAQLALATGGDVRQASTIEQTAGAILTIMTELRQQYYMAIESASSTGWHRLDVVTRRRNLRVKAREGYFVNPRGAARNSDD